MAKVREWERRMICRDCGRTIDVFRAPLGDEELWYGRDDPGWKRSSGRGLPLPDRSTGRVPNHVVAAQVPEPLLLKMANSAMAVYHCHPVKCGRVISLDQYQVARLCREADGGRFEV